MSLRFQYATWFKRPVCVSMSYLPFLGSTSKILNLTDVIRPFGFSFTELNDTDPY